MRIAAQVAAFPLLLVLAFAANAYASEYFAGYLFPRVLPRPYAEMVSAAVFGALTASAVVAWPIVRLYSRRSWLAALGVAAPVMAIRGTDLLHYASTNESRIIVMSLVEALVYPLAILAGVGLLSRRAHTSPVAPTKVTSAKPW